MEWKGGGVSAHSAIGKGPGVKGGRGMARLGLSSRVESNLDQMEYR